MSNLAELRDARHTATQDLTETVESIDAELRRLGSTQRCELVASLKANIHELQLLRRREISLIANGTEPPAPKTAPEH